MNEQERVEWLTRAVDAIVSGKQPLQPPVGRDDDGLDSLLLTAQARMESARRAAEAGLDHEEIVWRDLLAGLGEEAHSAKPEPAAETARDELIQLNEVARARRDMSEQMMRLAESHRLAVWADVQARIGGKSPEKSRSRLWRRARRFGDDPSPPARAPLLMPPVELRPRLSMGAMADSAAGAARQRVWDRVTSGVMISEAPAAVGAGRQRYRHNLAYTAAALALLVAAVGPLPATGLAEHPARQLAEGVVNYLGATEAAPPQVAELPAPEFVDGTTMTPAQAAARLGIPVADPSAPAGFQIVSSLYYSQPVTASSGGSFVMTFSSPDGEITIIQEAASGDDLAAGAGSITPIGLPDGTSAILIDGSWTAAEGGLGWSSGAGQSLVYDRNGARTTISSDGTGVHASTIIAIAASMSGQ
jgi:hypothetical protein